ncbi:Hypothetical protein R9X50_00519400 [Acrodontium crateriforme]|uniref:Syntaxin N-terminal domain-containing protein n=1 Tax=Acrodontium crateriforme TaxID=150365 RepID=A0AAQ3R5Q3_9PEZI|nr:Hypothetical protein R9X50_00519400 [Acrodontium crateriforme]
MSYNQQYAGYGGNPYEQTTSNTTTTVSSGAYGSSNPYTNDGGNPYGGNYGQAEQGYGSNTQQTSSTLNPPALQHNITNQSQTSDYDTQNGQPQQNIQYVQPGATLSTQDFLSRVEAVKADIRTLTTHVGQIASMHQRTLSSTDTSSSTQLESMVTQTQVLNTSIKDQIKFLEADTARSGDNEIKKKQVGQLKTSFTSQLQQYRVEEASYEKRYREQIARQYRIVNPEATDAEVQEAADADWGNEGVFQTALKTNRSATASSVLGAVRARHNDILKIEATLVQLQTIMEDLATAVVLQEAQVMRTEEHTTNVKNDTERGNQQLSTGIEHARRARKLKWWCLGICVLIVLIIALVLGLYFGLMNKNK